MRQYIMFYKDQKGIGGHPYIPFVKYLIKKEDGKYYYIANDKVSKVETPEDDYIIDDVKEKVDWQK